MKERYHKRIFVVVLALICLLALPGVNMDSRLAAASSPVPLISAPLVPSAAIPGGPGFTLTVNGTGFATSSTVNWNGNPRATVFVSSSQLAATILPSDIAAAGTASVTVTNPGSHLTSNLAFFDVTMPTSSVFFGPQAIPVGTQPISVAAADFNGDGTQDLAVTNENSSTLSVLLGNGDGTFATPVSYATGTAPVSVAAGDFNGDGKLDLAVANLLDGTVSILLGNGDGTFDPGPTVTVGSAPLSAIVGDFNGDGKLDLAIGNSGDSAASASILLGNGDGTFQPQATYTTGSGTISLVAGDFNKDGHLDLALSNLQDSVSILLGNGDGTFSVGQSYALVYATKCLVAADFNGDGNLDLAVVKDTLTPTGLVSILLGNGDGSFQPYFSYTTPQTPLSLTAGDFNGDGKIDLVVGTEKGIISTLLGNGDGTFQTHSDQIAGNSNRSLVGADFNRDGRLDLAIAAEDELYVLLQTSIAVSPTVIAYPPTPVGGSSGPQTVTLTNNGALALAISSITIGGTNSADFSQTNTCGSSLVSGATCTISATFTPTVADTRLASILISDTAIGSPQIVMLSGDGTQPGAVLSQTAITFGVQQVKTASAFQAVTLANNGGATLTISSITFSGDFFEENKCGSTLVSGATCLIEVRFRPRQGGTRTGVVTVTDDAMGSPQTLTLTGTGTVVELSTTAVNFGSQPINTTSPPMTVTLTNLGPAPLKIFAATINGAHPVFAQTNTCGTSVPGFGSCTFSITFTPVLKRGYAEILQIKDSGGGSPRQVSLIGTGE